MGKRQRILNLVNILNAANTAYYQEAKEIMSNKKYDALYDELLELEKQTGIVYGNSPTQKVGYEIVNELQKEAHEFPMLSLDKTKDPKILKEWLNNHEGILSWKLDGLTCVLTYNNGILQKAVTRGNGLIGEVITQNARQMVNIPLSIPTKVKLIVRGEAVISYGDFEKINQDIPNGEKYKNPRNLASGSIRQLNSKITKSRKVRFIAFDLILAEEMELNSIESNFQYLESLGFEVVERKKVTESDILQTIQTFSNLIETNPIPSDGLVLTYNDYQYGRSLGTTNKFPKHSIAYKWKDETVETKLINVEWSTSRTGLINPVAVFEPVELEGTTVNKATLNNLSFIENLEIGIGDILEVYKANKIIPTIDENLTRSNTLEIPKTCPTCGSETEVVSTKESKILVCKNPDCKAKRIAKFVHFVSRDCMNIEGLSEASLEFLIEKEWIKDFSDLFNLQSKRNEWIHYPGFGVTSVDKLLAAIEKAKIVRTENFIAALGIPGIGKSQSKILVKEFGSWGDFVKAVLESKDFSSIQGFGKSLNQSIRRWADSEAFNEARIFAESLEFVSEVLTSSGDKFVGKTFVITGELNLYKNRKELQEIIEKAGGKVSGSVSNKTTFLINNDVESSSSKNKKAKELGIKIITEEEFSQML